MKTLKCYLSKKLVPGCLISLLLFTTPFITTIAAPHTDENSEFENHYEYSGVVMDQKTGTPLEFANFLVIGTNISNVSNKDGEFILKVPKEIPNAKVKVSYIGYKDLLIPITSLKFKNSRINMMPMYVELPVVEVVTKNPYELISAVLDNKAENYIDDKTQMKAFYRETIKNKRDYVSLAEAVVNVVKEPYSTTNPDYAKFNQARKKTNYSEVDSLYLKLVGGPVNCLKLDILKNPDLIFTDNVMEKYRFSYEGSTFMDNKLIYIVNFKPSPFESDLLYYGKMYIDAESMALKSAVFSLDFKDRTKPTNMFIKEKPSKLKVYPIEANYRIDYFQQDGKWYFGYSRIELGFEVLKKKSGFNDRYFSTMEMAVINWNPYNKKNAFKHSERLLPSSPIANRVLGFTNPDFWGENNIIEPEKSIQSAIEKIRLELEKENVSKVDMNIQASK